MARKLVIALTYEEQVVRISPLSKKYMKYTTEEERKEAKRLSQIKFRQKYPNFWKTYKRKNEEEYKRKARIRNALKRIEYRKTHPYKERIKIPKEEKRKRQLEAYKKWRKANPNYWQDRIDNNPEEAKKVKARQFLNRKIIQGEIVRQNCWCGIIAEAHHDNYDRPLDVKWLCKLHHEEYHKNLIA